MKTEDNTDQILYLIYDGDCILCRNTAKALRLKQTVGELKLLNARLSHPLVDQIKGMGYDLNEGIIVKYQGKIYYGREAMGVLALLSSPVNLVNRINACLFRSSLSTQLTYPFFKLIRKMLLWLTGKSKIPSI